MKKMIPVFLYFLLFMEDGFSQSAPKDFIGAWKHAYQEGGKDVTATLIVTENYFSAAVYSNDGAFIKTTGGSYEFQDGRVSYMLEFNSDDPSMVGKTYKSEAGVSGNKMTVGGIQWDKIEQGGGDELSSAWLFAGRSENGEISRRQPGARKTMKILSGGRFQWIAYNSETGEFHGTGGGSYTAKDGKYTEKIEFFPRDPSRVGASLTFDFEVKEKDWHHKGKNSRGEPLYEIWSMREQKGGI